MWLDKVICNPVGYQLVHNSIQIWVGKGEHVRQQSGYTVANQGTKSLYSYYQASHSFSQILTTKVPNFWCMFAPITVVYKLYNIFTKSIIPEISAKLCSLYQIFRSIFLILTTRLPNSRNLYRDLVYSFPKSRPTMICGGHDT